MSKLLLIGPGKSYGALAAADFAAPAALAPFAPTFLAAGIFAIRPQTIGSTVTRRRSAAPTGGQIAERAYLGEYMVRPPDSDLRLRVSAAPNAVYEMDEAVWLEIDPGRIARIPSSAEASR